MLHYLGSYYIFNYTVSCYTILCYVMLNYVLLYHTILYSHLFKLSKVASSIILPAKTEPIWTLSEPVIKTLCLQMGGGPAPPTPRFFSGRAGLLSRTSHHEQDLHQTQNCFRAFQNSSYRQSVSNWGGVSPFFYAVQYRFRYHLAGKDRTHMNPFRTRHKDVVFANGGGGLAPQAPRFLFKPCRLVVKNIAP